MFVFQLAEYQKKQNLLTYFNGMLGMVWPEDKWLLFGADPDPGADLDLDLDLSCTTCLNEKNLAHKP